MILVDTSIWIDHLHRSEPELVRNLHQSQVASHPMIIGELALGSLRHREETIELLAALPSAASASHEEVLRFVAGQRLYGRGLSLVDAHLLASVLLTPDVRIWSRDKRLLKVSESFDVAHVPE